jgi:hypothetical protein
MQAIYNRLKTRLVRNFVDDETSGSDEFPGFARGSKEASIAQR